MQGQIVDAAVQGHDPAVEDILGLGALPAEIVDEKGAVEGLDVQRRLIKLGDRIIFDRASRSSIRRP